LGGVELLVPLLALILILLLLGGGGMALHILWYVLVIALVLWVLGFLVRGSGGGRWYYW
jgi:hypothetical protein